MQDVTLNRHLGIGGSDAIRIVRGDWHSLWLEKTGRAEPADLSNVFHVQLGKHTEDFHAEWFAKRTGFELERVPQRMTSAAHPFMFGHVDRYMPTHRTFLELKHSNGNATLRDAAQTYMPQLGHYCVVADVKACWLSVIPGNGEPVYGRIEMTQAYLDQLVEIETMFWWHVEQDVETYQAPPGVASATAKLAEANTIDGLRTYDFTSNNEFQSHAHDWITLRPSAQRFDQVVKDIKQLVPADAGEVYGVNLVVKRDKAGRLSIRER